MMVVNGWRSLKARFTGNSNVAPPTNFNKPAQGQLVPVAPFSAPVQKNAGIGVALWHSGVAGSGNPGGNPKT